MAAQEDAQPPPPPSQAQEDATLLLREVEARRRTLSTAVPDEIAAMTRMLDEFEPCAAAADEAALLPTDLGDLDDAAEFADAFWARATSVEMAWAPWPGSLWATCSRFERAVLSLRVLDQRVTVDFQAAASRVLLAREIEMPAASSDHRRVAQFHGGFRALQWASSSHFRALDGGDLREYFGKLTALRDCCETLRLGPALDASSKGEALVDDMALVEQWAKADVGRARLTVQPPDVLDCAAYEKNLGAIGCPPHVIVATFDPVKRATTTLCRLPLRGAKAVADLYMDVLHEAPSSRDWLRVVAPTGSWEVTVAKATSNVCS